MIFTKENAIQLKSSKFAFNYKGKEYVATPFKVRIFDPYTVLLEFKSIDEPKLNPSYFFTVNGSKMKSECKLVE